MSDDSNHPSKKVWEAHYTREKSKLNYPDENLVRILSRVPSSFNTDNPRALDFGAGSGRHCLLLREFGYDVTAADYSENSIQTIQESYPWAKAKLVDLPPTPFANEEFELVVNWGVLHYNSLELAKQIAEDFFRILKSGGYLAGSIRAVGDTHLKALNGTIGTSDLKGGSTWFYSEEDVRTLFQNFSQLEIGYTERTPIGKLEERICHWIFLAKK
ncbi:SAM-dependent methyltransferase [Leptospira perolatii]|uniref:SAM-dependent methyltransferase n=1 Tax=Leptospira perolatii TaxID=2023191 RepID=A0A2M9ZQ73_9LEPT|nr:class I SAM-dependent methyltransferase [Leptospira perolatii]PJZ70402.1 SAM-dependent methyltransferase [Leptospira perolatii]PJZ74238.1 SAM-dependent methyltransferase [Leptospira perolatii]